MKRSPARSKTITLSSSFLSDTYASLVSIAPHSEGVTCLGRAEPFVFVFERVHCDIKLPEVLVAEELIVNKIELPPGVGKAIAVPLPGKVHPLRMSEFVSFKVKVGLAPKSVNEESGRQQEDSRQQAIQALPDHFVQSKTPIDDFSPGREVRHVEICTLSEISFRIRTHLLVHEPEGKSLVPDKSLVVAFSVRH